jgi:WD40 repeat protein
MDEIRIWNAVSGKCLAVLEGGSPVVWSPDGLRLAGGGSDIRIWDAVSYECLAVLKGCISGVDTLAWSPDGLHLASVENDNTIRLWDVSSGKHVTIEIFDQEYAVWNEDKTLRFASPEAWQWLGWQTVRDGKIDRLPAELFGPLPTPP